MTSSRNVTVAKAVYRDYWRLEITSAPSGAPRLLVMAGRRRTTEPFWPPLGLPLNETGRILAAVGKAAQLGDQISGDRTGQAPMFPAHEVMAICRGPFYVIELAETTLGLDKASVLFTLLQTRGAIRPVLYLIDDELQEFLADLEKLVPSVEPRFAAMLHAESSRTREADGNGRAQDRPHLD
jgi:hypothetical protein